MEVQTNKFDGLSAPEKLVEGRALIKRADREVCKIIFGDEMRHLQDLAFVCLLADGHLMIRAPIGLAKTIFCEAFGKTIGGTMSKIQLTPDMQPGDLKGLPFFNQETGKYEVIPGPIVDRNVILADEINRATPKTQAALLGPMEERRVTVWKQEFQLGEVYLLLATRNPIEHAGTYDLPEAQLDRFFAQAILAEPSRKTSLAIIDDPDYWRPGRKRLERVNAVTNPQEIVTLREAIFASVQVDPRINEYITDIVLATREHLAVKKAEDDLPGDKGFGSSPRGLIQLKKAATIAAFMDESGYVLPEHVSRYAVDVLAHRIFLKRTYKNRFSGADVVKEALAHVPEP